MITSKTYSIRTAMRRAALFALGCAFTLSFVPVSALKAADAAPTPPSTEKGPKLPLTATFEKVTGGENGPYVLKLKNVSKDPVTVSTKILLSVVFHADNKARHLPEHVIKAAEVWSIPDLASADKVILTAKGFAPLEIIVP
jgi:hypothetical protein